MLPGDRSRRQRQIEEAHLRRAQQQARTLAVEGINEICEELLGDGGIGAALRGLALLLHGEILPADVVRKLQEQAARLRHSA